MGAGEEQDLAAGLALRLRFRLRFQLGMGGIGFFLVGGQGNDPAGRLSVGILRQNVVQMETTGIRVTDQGPQLGQFPVLIQFLIVAVVHIVLADSISLASGESRTLAL
jgi:hypothetical protein